MDMDNIGDTHAKYAHNGKVMLGSAILLFLILFVIIIIHNCRCRFRNHHQNRHIFPNPSAATPTAGKTKGLDPSFFKFLPTFTFSAAAGHRSPPECAVCLSEFEENDAVRVLPNCNHGFHTHCIDTWFLSHSNCPICRSPVQPLKIPPPQRELGGCSYLPPPIGSPMKALDHVELLSIMVESCMEEVVAGDSRRFKSSDEEILRMKTVWR